MKKIKLSIGGKETVCNTSEAMEIGLAENKFFCTISDVVENDTGGVIFVETHFGKYQYEFSGERPAWAVTGAKVSGFTN